MGRLEGQVAVVTGGASGIGHVFCTGLAAEGVKVVVADILEEQAASVVAEIENAGGEALAVRVDVASVESTEAMARAALERFGRIDILVTCAAIYATLERRDFIDIPPEEWNKVLAVNLTGAQLCARAVLPTMKEQGSGSVVNMGSVNAYIAPAGRAHYSAGKAALENLTKTLAREMGPFGIRVNSLSPGLVEHEGTIVPEERYKRQAEERAMHRAMTPEDLVGPLVFLCSEDAAMVTGHSLVVDGGQIFR
jgi:NAD(P)-dependent dehydrogenase (short-subunit alcohol dehydrogenase family)